MKVSRRNVLFDSRFVVVFGFVRLGVFIFVVFIIVTIFSGSFIGVRVCISRLGVELGSVSCFFSLLCVFKLFFVFFWVW